MVARPRNMVNNPKALVSFSRPNTSTRTMEVRVTREATQSPNMRLRMRNSVKVVRKGKMKRQTADRRKEKFIMKRESTQTKSARAPQRILPTVLEIPMTERRRAAWSAVTVLLWAAREGR